MEYQQVHPQAFQTITLLQLRSTDLEGNNTRENEGTRRVDGQSTCEAINSVTIIFTIGFSFYITMVSSRVSSY